jgi:hypothetical protein
MVERNTRELKTNSNNLWNYVIIAFTCLAPFGFILEQGEGWHYFYILALLWSYSDWSDTHGTAMAGFSFVDPLSIIFTSILSSLRFLFAYSLMKHLKGVGSRRDVWISAVLSQLPFSLYVLGSLFASGSIGFSMGFPVPLFIIVGLAIAHFKGREVSDTPWSEEDLIS